MKKAAAMFLLLSVSASISTGLLAVPPVDFIEKFKYSGDEITASLLAPWLKQGIPVCLDNCTVVLDQENFVLEDAQLLIKGDCRICCGEGIAAATFRCGANGFVCFCDAELEIDENVTFIYALRETTLYLHKQILCEDKTSELPVTGNEKVAEDQVGTPMSQEAPTDVYKRLKLEGNVFYVSVYDKAFCVSLAPLGSGS